MVPVLKPEVRPLEWSVCFCWSQWNQLSLKAAWNPSVSAASEIELKPPNFKYPVSPHTGVWLICINDPVCYLDTQGKHHFHDRGNGF